MSYQSSGRGVRPSGLRLDYLTRPQLFAVGAAAVVAVAAFLPWYSAFGLGISGIRGQGKLTLLCALVGIAATAFATDVVGRRTLTRQAYFTGMVPAAGLVLLTALRKMNDYAGVGLYLTLLAGVAWAAALVWDINEHSARRPLG